MRRWLPLVLLVPAACASGGDPGFSADIEPAYASLTIDVERVPGQAEEATLGCTADGTGASGTGWLADRAAASAACDVVLDNEERLHAGEPEDRVCTLQYGGPEVARVTGDLDGRSVAATFRRNDGCGIHDWSIFEPLLGPPANT